MGADAASPLNEIEKTEAWIQAIEPAIREFELILGNV
jgi:hypothetical protein